MRLGDLLIGQGLATLEEVGVAVERQKSEGGRLGTQLVAMGVLTVDQLLTALRSQQEADATLGLCERTLQRSQLTYGRDHPNTHRAQYNLARALLAAGRAADSVSHAETACAGQERTLGTSHAWSQEAAQLVAKSRHAASRVEQAQAVLLAS
ncbi:MAG TPA: tetratricopeptide repeat protein [Stellaceae bacterium]|nr:tetratricopeptide repeat protein [Stellaceae bacterium]